MQEAWSGKKYGFARSRKELGRSTELQEIQSCKEYRVARSTELQGVQSCNESQRVGKELGVARSSKGSRVGRNSGVCRWQTNLTLEKKQKGKKQTKNDKTKSSVLQKETMPNSRSWRSLILASLL